MSRLLVAVKSCFRDLDAGAHDNIRGTWGAYLRDRGIQTKFFLGRPSLELGGVIKSVHPTPQNSYSPKSDEVILECPDTYEGLVFKTRGICQWMTDRALDHVLLVDTDCCVYPKRIEKSNYEIADYAGTFNGEWGACGPREIRNKDGQMQLVDRVYSWASGAGYFLSRKAATIIADTFPKASVTLNGANEDYWVGQVLGMEASRGEILSMPLEQRVVKYFLTPEGHSKGHDPKSSWMRDQWAAYLSGDYR
jgi:hypothetical protein